MHSFPAMQKRLPQTRQPLLFILYSTSAATAAGRSDSASAGAVEEQKGDEDYPENLIVDKIANAVHIKSPSKDHAFEDILSLSYCERFSPF